MVKEHQGAKNLLRKPSDQLKREATEIVSLNKLIQVDTQKFGGYAKMATEIKALDEVDDTMATLGILEIR